MNSSSPYGSRFLPIEAIDSILEHFEEGREVRAAGRLMTRRIMGKSTFADLKDDSGRVQIYGKKDELNEEYDAFASLRMGDILGVEGNLFTSKTGEKSIRIRHFQLLSKIVRTLPEKWHGLKDVEVRYRQRYVDLIVNNQVMDTFKKRSRIIRQVREFLNDQGFLEVETPMMQAIPGGARARPFTTHHNALNLDLFLRVAPELYLKRLLVGGMQKVYELNRNFRNEGISTRHNPEFTMLEVYQAFADYTDMMRLTEELISKLAFDLHGTYEIPYAGKTINFKTPWKRLSFYEEFCKIGIDVCKSGWRQAALKVCPAGAGSKIEDADLLDEIFSAHLEPHLWDPTFVIDYPTVTTPLAKAKEDNPELVYRFELFAAKMELANAFSELNDPEVQRERLTAQKEIMGENKVIDEDFVTALEFGMPPAGGLGIGIDRLVMLLTGNESIREVILFPQLKPAAQTADDERGETG